MTLFEPREPDVERPLRSAGPGRTKGTIYLLAALAVIVAAFYFMGILMGD